MPLWTFPHILSLAVAEILVFRATLNWSIPNQTMAVCATFLLFVVTHFDED